MGGLPSTFREFQEFGRGNLFRVFQLTGGLIAVVAAPRIFAGSLQSWCGEVAAEVSRSERKNSIPAPYASPRPLACLKMEGATMKPSTSKTKLLSSVRLQKAVTAGFQSILSLKNAIALALLVLACQAEAQNIPLPPTVIVNGTLLTVGSWGYSTNN